MQFLENKPYYRNHHLQRCRKRGSPSRIVETKWKGIVDRPKVSYRPSYLFITISRQGEILKISHRFGEIDTEWKFRFSFRFKKTKIYASVKVCFLRRNFVSFQNLRLIYVSKEILIATIWLERNFLNSFKNVSFFFHGLWFPSIPFRTMIRIKIIVKKDK